MLEQFQTAADKLQYTVEMQKFQKLQGLIDSLNKSVIPSLSCVQNSNSIWQSFNESRKALDDVENYMDQAIKTLNIIWNAINDANSKAKNCAEFQKESKLITDIFKKLLNLWSQDIISMRVELIDESPSCGNLPIIWKNIGEVYCNEFGKPVQGLWASIGLSAVILIVLRRVVSDQICQFTTPVTVESNILPRFSTSNFYNERYANQHEANQ
uniref:Transmembrane protein n=1 Tax=Syphacia muris TaxID=451379 RepID=A0A0N5AXS8_9BILA